VRAFLASTSITAARRAAPRMDSWLSKNPITRPAREMLAARDFSSDSYPVPSTAAGAAGTPAVSALRGCSSLTLCARSDGAVACRVPARRQE
jgi:hypothetical protein